MGAYLAPPLCLLRWLTWSRDTWANHNEPIAAVVGLQYATRRCAAFPLPPPAAQRARPSEAFFPRCGAGQPRTGVLRDKLTTA